MGLEQFVHALTQVGQEGERGYIYGWEEGDTGEGGREGQSSLCKYAGMFTD